MFDKEDRAFGIGGSNLQKARERKYRCSIVELKNVSVSYREDVALKNVSLTVDEREK